MGQGEEQDEVESLEKKEDIKSQLWKEITILDVCVCVCMYLNRK